MRLSQRQLLAAVVIVIAIHALATANRRRTHAGDFDISRELGRRFLAGEHLYAGGLHYPYMPAAAMVFAPLALLPSWLGFALRYALALLCLWFVMRWLARVTCAHAADPPAHAVRVIALTLLLASHYLLRDLDDGGPHLLLLGVVIAGLACSERHQLVFAAAAVGFAIAVKAPHGLLLLFFAWQRRWRLLLFSIAGTVCWVALPSVWMGPSSWWRHQMEWNTTVAASVSGDPLPGVRDSEERVQNQAIAPTVARVSRRFGAGDVARWLGLAASAGVLAGLIIATARAGGRPWLYDASAVLIATPMLAPLAWVQHLVVVIPGLALLLSARTTRVVRVSLGIFAFLTLVLNREIIGRTPYLELLTYGLHTVAVLLLLALLLRDRAGVSQ